MPRYRSPVLSFLYNYRWQLLFIAIAVYALIFRLRALSNIPPGLHPVEAELGLKLVESQERLGVILADIQTVLYRAPAAAAVKLLGRTPFALRLVPALYSLIGVAAAGAWLYSWFGRRTALIGAFLAAVTAWGIHFARFGGPEASLLLFIPLSLWLAGEAYRRNSAKYYWLAAASIAGGLYAHPQFIWLVIALGAIALAAALKFRSFKVLPKSAWPAVGAGVLVSLPALYSGYGYLAQNLSPINLFNNFSRTILAYNVRGGDSYLFNLGGQPLFNVFTGIMLLLGVMVAFKSIGQRRYSALLAALGILMLPAVFAGENANQAQLMLGSLLPAIGLAAIGTDYLIEEWFKTFPLNAAARHVGTAAVVVLLILSARQAYNQYFLAWAQSPQTHDVYRADAVEMASYIRNNPVEGERFVITDDQAATVLAFLNPAGYSVIKPEDIDGLEVKPVQRQFLISPVVKTEALKKMSLKFPDGELKSHIQNNTEHILIYTVKP